MAIKTKSLGQKIKTARKCKGLTQQDLSELVDCSPTYISYIESGHKTMSLDTLVSIANALQVSADVLLSDSLDCFSVVNAHTTYDLMADCSPIEKRILTDILVAAKLSIKKNRRYR